jgi:hypothetical protein
MKPVGVGIKEEAGDSSMSGSANFSLARKLFSITAPVNSWRRRVRTIVAAPRAVGEAKKTSRTT